MIGLIDEIAIYLTFGIVTSAGGYLLYFLKDLNSRTRLNTEFSGKVIMSIQDINKAVIESQSSVNLLMQTLGLPTSESDKKESEEEDIPLDNEDNKKSTKNSSKMNYMG